MIGMAPLSDETKAVAVTWSGVVPMISPLTPLPSFTMPTKSDWTSYE